MGMLLDVLRFFLKGPSRSWRNIAPPDGGIRP